MSMMSKVARTSVAVAGLAFATIAARPACAREAKPAVAQASRPNIVIIVSDDHGLDAVGAYGNRVIRTPNIDGLARDGILFTNAFSTVSSCSPSRAALLSGRYAHSNGMFGLSHMPYNFSSFPGTKAFSNILADNGYRTALMGKYHVAPESAYRFDTVLASAEEVEAGLGRSPVEMALRTRSFINSTDKKPFLLYFAPTDPHRLGPYTLGKSNHFGARPEGRPGITPQTYDPKSVLVPSFLPDLPETREEIAYYYQAVSRMDQGIGQLIAELKKAGKYDNTLIMYLSDNGVAMPGAKTNLYDPGIHLPLIVKMPGGARKAARSDALVSWTDIAPTVVDFAGLKPGSYDFQGASIRQVLNGAPEVKGRTAVFGSHTMHEIHMFYPMRMIRTKNYKLIQNFAWRQPFPPALDLTQSSTWQATLRNQVPLGKRTLDQFNNRPEYELFDMRNDPDEVVNLATNPKYRSVLEDLTGQLHDFMRTTKDPFVIELGPIESGS